MNLENLHRYFHRAGWPFIGGLACVTLLLAFVDSALFTCGLVLTAACAYFFRDPARVTPVRAGLIISPADGKVVALHEVLPDIDLALGNARRLRISIFLSPCDVHVNRIPADAVVQKSNYRSGTFINASLDKASDQNERMALALQLTGDHPYDNQLLGVVQIAGLIARRIVCNVKEGDTVKAGTRYGIIRFGSRVDVYLPPGLAPQVAIGQTVVGGETILADCASKASALSAEIRE